MLLCGGISCFVLPMLLQKGYDSQTAELKTQFLEQIKEPSKATPNDGEVTAPTKGLDELYAYLKSENERLYASGQEALSNPGAYEQPAINLEEYGIKDNIIGFISLPTINMELPIYLGANEANMKKGAVHLTGTSYPIGGKNTNCVIAAHRGTALVMFRYINRLKNGDPVQITNFRQTLNYRVTGHEIISSSQSSKIRIVPGKELLTLCSCNFYRGGFDLQRYIVYCEPV